MVQEAVSNGSADARAVGPVGQLGAAGGRFTLVRRGFDPQEVRAYLEHLADRLATMEGELQEERIRGELLSRRVALSNETAETTLSRHLADVIRSVDQARERSRAQAQTEARRLVASAQDEAGRVVALARTEADALHATARADAERVLIDAQTEAERLLDEASFAFGPAEEAAVIETVLMPGAFAVADPDVDDIEEIVDPMTDHEWLARAIWESEPRMLPPPVSSPASAGTPALAPAPDALPFRPASKDRMLDAEVEVEVSFDELFSGLDRLFDDGDPGPR